MTSSSSPWDGMGPGPGFTQAFDEMVDGRGSIRPHWEGVIGALRSLTTDMLRERAERIRRQIEESGVSYTVYGSGDESAARPWSLDLVPLVITGDDWARIEEGIRQRVRVLDALTADIFGAQRLIAAGTIPAGLVYRHPEFLRPLRMQADVELKPRLHFYAADLVRGPDGAWRVLADRTQAAAGAGYALENRKVVTRLLPEAAQSVAVRRMRGFFDSWAEQLRRLAPPGRSNPRVVLLTPGRHNEVFFEHVLLSQELGLNLVEAADLTVRSQRVFLKTLGGLRPVDVILRRTDAAWCDPLELRPDSMLGIPGLVEAVRAGGVAVANSLGSAIVESPAITAYLPDVARSLLGEDLIMAQVPCRWCGDLADGRELPFTAGDTAVHGQLALLLQDMIVRHTFAPSVAPIDAGALDEEERAALAARIAAAPEGYTLQRPVPPSSAPRWTPDGLDPTPIVLRVFAASDGTETIVMPGGLARVPGNALAIRTHLQAGGMSKDVWVLTTDRKESITAATGPAPRVEICRTSGELQSRVADNLFWLGRYCERLDGMARSVRALTQRLLQGGLSPRENLEVGLLLQVLSGQGLVPPMSADPLGPGYIATALKSACGLGGGVYSAQTAIGGLADSLRDRFSADMWQRLKRIAQAPEFPLANRQADPVTAARPGAERSHPRSIDRLSDPPGVTFDRIASLMDRLIGDLSAVSGLVAENMTRGSGWRFLDLGRRLERTLGNITVLRTVLSAKPANEEAALRVALDLCDNTITYRTRYLAALQVAPVVDLLLLDPTNPRSVTFQIAAIAEHMRAIPHPERIGDRAGDVRIAEMLEAELARTSLADLASLGSRDAVAALEARLQLTERSCWELSDMIGRVFFSHVSEGQTEPEQERLAS